MRLYLISILSLITIFAFGEQPTVLHWSGMGDENVTDVLTVEDGATYVTGQFSGSLVLNGKTYNSKGGNDLFLAKLTGSMRPQWTKILQSSTDITKGKLAVGPSGEIMWLASAQGDAYLDGQRLSPITDSKWIIVNVHESGKVEDIQYQVGPNQIGAFDLSYDDSGNGYLLATYRDNTGNGWMTTLTKWSWAGDILWQKDFAGVKNTRGAELHLNEDGHPIAILNFSGTLEFDEASYTANGNSDFIVARFDPNGNLQWAERSNGEGHDMAEGFAFDASGNLYVCGLYTQGVQFGALTDMVASDRDIFVVKFSNTGKVEWLRTGRGGIGSDKGLSIMTNEEGVYLTGTYTEGITFGKRSLSGTASREVYLAHYDWKGLLKDVSRIGGRGIDKGTELAYQNPHQLLLGSFHELASIGGTTLEALDGSDVFIWQVN